MDGVFVLLTMLNLNHTLYVACDLLEIDNLPATIFRKRFTFPGLEEAVTWDVSDECASPHDEVIITATCPHQQGLPSWPSYSV